MSLPLEHVIGINLIVNHWLVLIYITTTHLVFLMWDGGGSERYARLAEPYLVVSFTAEKMRKNNF
jgi:hypothetical protein